MRRGLAICLAILVLAVSVASNATQVSAAGRVYIAGPVTVDKANPMPGEIVSAQVTLVNTTGSTFSAKLWGIGGRGPGGWEQDIQDCGFVSDYSLGSGLSQGMQCQIVARDPGQYTLFAVYQDYGGGWHEVFDLGGASRKGYFTVTYPPPPKLDRNSLPTTSTPQVGSYFRLPRAVQVFRGPDGSFQNSLSSGLVVKIKGGPQRGSDGRIWWDLSEEEWGGGTGWFTLEDPRPVAPKPTPPPPSPPPAPTPNPAPPAPTPAPPPGGQHPPQSQGYCYQVSSVTYPNQLGPSETGTFSALLTNCGQVWDHDVLLGTYSPRDMASPFATNGWIRDNRAVLLPGNIGYGQSVNISFQIKAPSIPGTYSQTFLLVAEWRAWMSGPLVTVTAQVSSKQSGIPQVQSNWSYQLSSLTYPKSVSSGQRFTATATMVNTGGPSWDHDILLGTWGPRDHIGLFEDSTWPSINRVTYLPNGVVSGQQVTFSFILQAPDLPGIYQESFRIVSEWRSWMAGPDILVQVNVLGSSQQSGVQTPVSTGNSQLDDEVFGNAIDPIQAFLRSNDDLNLIVSAFSGVNLAWGNDDENNRYAVLNFVLAPVMYLKNVPKVVETVRVLRTVVRDRVLFSVVRDGQEYVLKGGWSEVVNSKLQGEGWIHIFRRHVLDTGESNFWRAFGPMSDGQLKQLINDSVRYGQKAITPRGDPAFEYSFGGRVIRTVIGKDGKSIITSFPLE